MRILNQTKQLKIRFYLFIFLFNKENNKNNKK